MIKHDDKLAYVYWLWQVNIELKNLIAKQIGENENSAEEPRENGTACAQEDLSGSSDIHEENSEEADVDGG